MAEVLNHARIEIGRSLLRDPRAYQISVLAGLLGYGMLYLDLDVDLLRVLLLLASALLAQAFLGSLFGKPFDCRSSLISELSLSLLAQ